ncbi:MAG: YdcF family protein, partial [Bacteroidales bacterium]
VVEGGFAEYDKVRDRIEFSEGADRLTDAIILYHNRRIRKIIISGDGSVITRDSIGSPEKMIKFLNYMGIPNEDIIIEPNARNTKEHPEEILKLLGERIKSENILIITSAIHLKRSLSAFERNGIKADGYGVDITTDDPKYIWADWIPDLNLPSKWYWLIHEQIGCFVYKLI